MLISSRMLRRIGNDHCPGSAGDGGHTNCSAFRGHDASRCTYVMREHPVHAMPIVSSSQRSCKHPTCHALGFVHAGFLQYSTAVARLMMTLCVVGSRQCGHSVASSVECTRRLGTARCERSRWYAICTTGANGNAECEKPTCPSSAHSGKKTLFFAHSRIRVISWSVACVSSVLLCREPCVCA